MTNTNPYCAALGIPIPRVETACSSPDANYYGLLLDVVVGSALGWTDPWSRARQAFPATDAWGWPSRLVDEQGYEIPRADVQLARFSDNAE